MRVYFLRHGKSVDAAVWRADDGVRPLTEEGFELMRLEGARMRALKIRPDVIVTSPLTRAQQTADVVAEELGLTDVLVEDERLAPGFDRDDLVGIIDAHPGAETMMIVGHEPDFSSTMSTLMGGGRLQLKKGGLGRVDIVERVGDMIFGVLVFLLTPGQLSGE